jgi:hypothetical protein
MSAALSAIPAPDIFPHSESSQTVGMDEPGSRARPSREEPSKDPFPGVIENDNVRTGDSGLCSRHAKIDANDPTRKSAA